MESEQAAASELGINWDVRLFCPEGSTPPSPITKFTGTPKSISNVTFVNKLSAWSAWRREYYEWLHEQEAYYDTILLRYHMYDPYQLQFLRKVKRPVYLVHHTLEVPELAKARGRGGLVRALLELMLGRRTIRAAHGVIGVTQEIVDYELKRAKGARLRSTVYPNGITTSESPLDARCGAPTEILFVASSFSSWQGLDLLLKSVRQSGENFILHIVGTTSDVDREKANKDPRVRFHGRLSQDEIAKLSARCSLGLSSLALHRKNMKQACTLKAREYLKLGLPVYAGYQDVFCENFPYFRCGPCDVDAILAYANEHTTTSRAEVVSAAHPKIDKKVLLMNLYEWLNGVSENTIKSRARGD